MNIEKALLNPTSVFRHPGEVLFAESLSKKQKVQVLRRWEYDARELQVAAEENMAGGPEDRLDEVLKALHKLDADVDFDHSSPTKHGGE